ncbi:hypothetical protein Tco_0474910 [Tanacetum coccineum]
MLLTRLFNYVMSESLEFSKDRYVLCDRVMYPLTAQQERKTQKDYGTRRDRSSTSSSSAFDQPSPSHPNDDDNDGNDKGTSRASTHFPTRFVNSLSNDIPQIFSNPPDIEPNMEALYTRQTEILNRQLNNHLPHDLHHLYHISLYSLPTSMASTQASSSNPSKKIKLTIIPPRQLFVDLTSKEYGTTTPSLITKSSSTSPPNALSKTPLTKDTSSSFGTNSSLFESKPQSLPPSSNDTPSLQPSNPFLDDIMDASLRPSNPIPL